MASNNIDSSSQPFLASCTQDADYEVTQTISIEPSRWGCVVPTSNNHSDSITVVGRDPRKAQVIFNDPKISSVHCSIERKTDDSGLSATILVNDLSTNGTFLFNPEPKSLDKIGKNLFRVINSGTEIILIPKAHNREKLSFVVYIDPPSEKKLLGPHLKYDIRDQLGFGAFATVHLCIDRNTGNKYACKIVDKHKFKAHSSTRQDSLLDEVRILESLNHENIVKIYECFETEDNLYIILELVSGGDLFDRIVSVQKFSETESLHIFKQLHAAISYIHGLNIIHRDLKPENILLSNKYNLTVKISDFGLSRVVSSINQAKTMCGTMQYLAPEVIEQKASYGASVDIWSLGVNLYILLCGYQPFDDSDDCRVPMLIQMTTSSYKFPDDPWRTISKEAKDLISRMLTPDFKRRITIKEIGQHPWVLGFGVPSSGSNGSTGLQAPSQAVKSEFAEPPPKVMNAPPKHKI